MYVNHWNCQELKTKLQAAIEAGLLPGWQLAAEDAVRLVPEAADGLTITFHHTQGRYTAYANFPSFENHDCGRQFLPQRTITLAADRPALAFARDLKRRLLDPALAALPKAAAYRDTLRGEVDEQKAIFTGLAARLPGDKLLLPREDRLRGAWHRMGKQGHSVSVKVDVRRANRHGQYGGYPAAVDIELRGLPPAIAAAILDLLGEEATN